MPVLPNVRFSIGATPRGPYNTGILVFMVASRDPFMLDFALTALASVLFVVDPVGAVPGYLAMTEGDDAAKRTRTAWRASLAAAVVLAAFAAAGKVMFRF